MVGHDEYPMSLILNFVKKDNEKILKSINFIYLLLPGPDLSNIQFPESFLIKI